MILPLDLRFIRIMRFIRLIRLLKLSRYSETLKTFSNVFKEKIEELMIALFLIIILLIIASCLMYYVEHQAQPEAFSSIPAAMWWAVATLTTVGYGDIVPKTLFGKILGAVIALIGIGLFAMPAGILAAGFAEQIAKKKKIICPHCGRDVEKK